MGGFVFRNRIRTVGAGWQPDGSGISARRTYAADGPDCVVGAEAYGAKFTRALVPNSAITVWVYPIEGREDYPGYYLIGYRVECSERWPGSGGVDPYEESFLVSDDEEEFWGDLGACSAVCRDVAEDLAKATTRDEIPWNVAEHFNWDGAILSLDGDNR
jgi:hypothetical protein